MHQKSGRSLIYFFTKLNLRSDIQVIIKHKGQTRGEFAILCDITPRITLLQIQHVEKEPNLSTLKTISDRLKLPLLVLFFLSMNEEDVQPTKRKAFGTTNFSIKSLISELCRL